METRAHYVAVGAFVLAVIFLAFVAVLWLGRAEFAQETKRYYIYFRGSVAGLSKGSQVQYNGIPVGRVIDIRVDPTNLEQIQVTVEIDTSIVNIKSDAQAFLEANILNGIATVQIRGGTREASDLVPRPGHKYAVITAGRSELEEVKASLPELVADLKAAAHRLNDLLDENNRRAVSDTLQNLRSITGALVEPSREVGEVVNNANKAVVELRSLFHNLEQSYVEKGGLKDQLSQTLGDADRLAKNLTDASRQLQGLIQENRPGIRDFTHNTLNQLGDLVTDLKRFVAGMTRFATELERNPPKLLFGDRREGYRPQ
ncbi:MAG TPA: MlaD family protein [Stellaceae bacterium]|jgi:phospholipid/cholesterol/gamma-HCH transport system substrate-binding protein|nr:MlaD family protein [Stellaceae bacterium]